MASISQYISRSILLAHNRIVSSTKKYVYGDNLGIFGAIFYFLLICLCSILHYIASPFTVLSHWVSNLGGDNTIARPFFNFGLQITAIILGVFLTILTFRLWAYLHHRKIILILGWISGMIASIGIIILTINTMFEEPDAHLLGATMFFIGILIFMPIYFIAFCFTPFKSKAQKWIIIWNLFLFVLIIPSAIITVKFVLYPELQWTDLQVIHFQGILASMDPKLGFLRLLEWNVLFGFFLWLFQTAIDLKKFKN
jgi:hypothetical protein